jgi:hypothetical protein
MGLDTDMDLSALHIRCDEVYGLVHENEHTRPQVLFWCMDLGHPWQQ